MITISIKKDVLISIIKKYPSYIEYIREPSKHLCEIAFKGDPTLFKKIYNYVSIETLVEAVYFDPSNICYAGSKGIYSRELYNLALSVINSGKKKVSSYTIDICSAYLDGIEEIEKNQKSIVEHIKKI